MARKARKPGRAGGGMISMRLEPAFIRSLNRAARVAKLTRSALVERLLRSHLERRGLLK